MYKLITYNTIPIQCSWFIPFHKHSWKSTELKNLFSVIKNSAGFISHIKYKAGPFKEITVFYKNFYFFNIEKTLLTKTHFKGTSIRNLIVSEYKNHEK